MGRPSPPPRGLRAAAASGPDRRGDALRAVLLVAAGLGHLAWLASVAVNLGTPELARRDWSALREAGRALGEPTLYGPEPGGFPFLHPPPVAALAAPFSGLGDLAFYGLVLGLTLIGGAAIAAALRRPLGRAFDLALLAGLASAPWLIGLTVGQPIALLVGVWLLGWRLLDTRPFAAGLLWSVCALKPTFAAPLLGFALARRRPRAALGLLLGIAAWAALALPWGLEAYAAWVEAMAREHGPAALSWRQHTLFALFAFGADRAGLPLVGAWAGWGLVALPLLGLALVRARRGSSLRALGVVALATVVLSPYAYFYDALLLLVPLAAALAERASYPAAAWRSVVAAAALTFVSQHLLFFAAQAGPPLAAAPALLWLIAELRAADAERVTSGR